MSPKFNKITYPVSNININNYQKEKSYITPIPLNPYVYFSQDLNCNASYSNKQFYPSYLSCGTYLDKTNLNKPKKHKNNKSSISSKSRSRSRSRS